jgi:hypothetical protein
VSSATAADGREVRHFELEADRRAKRMFVLIVVGFALLAVFGGIFTAYLLLWDEDPPIAIAPAKPKPPEPVDEFVPPVPWREDAPEIERRKSTGAKLAETLSDRDLGRGMAALQAAFDDCARTHGAIDAMVVNIDFSVGSSGKVEESDARPPFGKTPLGQCVANVVRTKGSFARTRIGRRDIRWSVKLRRTSG